MTRDRSERRGGEGIGGVESMVSRAVEDELEVEGRIRGVGSGEKETDKGLYLRNGEQSDRDYSFTQASTHACLLQCRRHPPLGSPFHPISRESNSPNESSSRSRGGFSFRASSPCRAWPAMSIQLIIGLVQLYT
jgi:hypothetical protein